MQERDAVEILEELTDLAKCALIVTGFWDKSFSGKEVEIMTKLFRGTVRSLNQKTNALSTAIDIIEQCDNIDVDAALQQINLELVGL